MTTNYLHQISITPAEFQISRISCTCGFSMTSMDCDAQFIAHEHREWADKPKPAKRRAPRYTVEHNGEYRRVTIPEREECHE